MKCCRQPQAVNRKQVQLVRKVDKVTKHENKSQT